MSDTTVLENRLKKRNMIFMPLLPVNSCFVLVKKLFRLYFPKYLIASYFATGTKGGCYFTDFSRDSKTWASEISGVCQLESLSPRVAFF